MRYYRPIQEPTFWQPPNIYTRCRETLESTSKIADCCLGTSVDICGYIGLILRFSIASAPRQTQWHEYYLVSPKLHNGSGTNQHRTRYWCYVYRTCKTFIGMGQPCLTCGTFEWSYCKWYWDKDGSCQISTAVTVRQWKHLPRCQP